MLVYCHKMNIIMIMSAISPSTQPASCHTSDHHCGVRTAYQLIILFKQKITCPTTTTGSDLREGERWNTIILSSVLGPQLSSMLDVGYGNWQVDKCSTNVWIGDPLFMSTPLLNIETICQHSNMLSLSLSLCPLTQDIALHAQWIFSSPRGRFSPLNLTYLTYWILLYPQAIRGINTKLFLFSGKYWADFWHRDYIETLFSIHEFCRITGL